MPLQDPPCPQLEDRKQAQAQEPPQGTPLDGSQRLCTCSRPPSGYALLVLLQQLPQDVVTSILASLSRADRNALRVVCRATRDMARAMEEKCDVGLGEGADRVTSFRKCKPFWLEQRDVKDLGALLPNIQQLSIKTASYPGDLAVLAALPDCAPLLCQRLQHLELSLRHIVGPTRRPSAPNMPPSPGWASTILNGDASQALWPVLQACSTISYLSISGSLIHPAYFKLRSSALTSLDGLRHLFQSNAFLTFEQVLGSPDVVRCVTAVRGPAKVLQPAWIAAATILQDLSLSFAATEAPVTEADASHAATLLSSAKQLTSLQLNTCRIWADDSQAFLSIMLTCLTSLKSLDFHGVTYCALQPLFDIVSQLGIQSLSLNFGRIPDQDLSDDTEEQLSFRTVEDNLSGNMI